MSKRDKKAHPIVSTLVDAGATWTSHGLDAGKLSLENGARALTRAARTVENLAREIEKRKPPPTE